MGEVILLGRTHCQLGLTKGQRRTKNAIITGSLRTLVEFVWVVGARSRKHGSKSRAFEPNAGQRIVWTEAGKRLEAVKPTHPHTWDFADTPHVNGVFLGPRRVARRWRPSFLDLAPTVVFATDLCNAKWTR